MRNCFMHSFTLAALLSVVTLASAAVSSHGIPNPAVIAHRGASYDAPESTLPAYLLAREIGADYLEMDLQRTRDGVLVAVHDDVLTRTSNVAERFPERQGSPVSAFTLAELKSLDVGSWFNRVYPERARAAYRNLRILTLDEVIDIAEGNPERRPGLYIETKQPAQFPGIEEDLKQRLAARGWLEQPGRVVLQTFDRHSLELLHQAMPQAPKILLLWVGKGGIEPASGRSFAGTTDDDKAAFYAQQQPKDHAEFERWLDYAKAGGAIGTGPSATRNALGEQSYADLIQPWMIEDNHARGLLVHAYTLDDAVDFERAMKAGVDGIFTNRAGELMRFYGRPVAQSEGQLLRTLGY